MTDVAGFVDFLSPSRIRSWLRCQQQWFYVYVEGMRWRPSAGMAAGNAFDFTANDAYVEKLGWGATPSVEDLQGVFAAAWDREAETVEDLGADERGSILDDGVGVLPDWRDRVMVHVDPIAAQESFAFSVHLPDQAERNAAAGVGDQFRVRGYRDLRAVVQGREVVIDHKFSRKRWAQSDATRELQPVAYALDGPRVFQFHVAQPMAKKRRRLAVVQRTVTEDDVREFCATAGAVRRQIAHAVRSGDFIRNRGHNLCSKRWCGFWERCVKDHGGTVAS